MNFDLDENQELFKQAVERFLHGQDVAARHAQRRKAGGFDRERWRSLAELGAIALSASEGDGGLGGSLLDCAVVAQAIGQGIAVEPWLECGFLPARLLAGSPWLADVASGDRIAAFALAGSATARNGRLSGEKRLVLGGAAADLLIVVADAGGEDSLFVIPSDAAGVDLRPYIVVDGGLAAVVTLRDVEAGAPVGDHARLDAVLDEVRLMAAAEMVGIARRLLDETLTYVKQREQFGQPIGRFQVIQHRLVDAYAKVEAAQSGLWRGLLAPDAVPSAIRAFVAGQAQWVAEQAVQLHGGMGMTDELAIGHGLKRILLLSKLFGDDAGGAALARAA